MADPISLRPQPPSPWASPLVRQDRKLGMQNRSLTAADHRGGAGVGQFDQQPIDTLASFLDLLALLKPHVQAMAERGLTLTTVTEKE